MAGRTLASVAHPTPLLLWEKGWTVTGNEDVVFPMNWNENK